MQKSSFNKLSILLFIIVILSSCNKDNGIEEISESYIEIKVLRISKDNTKTPIYNAIAYIYYDIAPIDLANYTDKGMPIFLMLMLLKAKRLASTAIPPASSAISTNTSWKSLRILAPGSVSESL